MQDAEIGQRGYLITGVEEYLDPYNAALPAVAPHLKTLRTLTVDNVNQQRRIDMLARLSDEFLTGLKDRLDVRRHEGFEVARLAVLKGKSKALMEDIRKVLAEMNNEEQVLVLLGLFIQHNIAQPLSDLSSTAARMATGDLSLSAPADHRRDEVGVLLNTFSHMLQYQRAMVRVAERIAEGDLTVDVHPQSEHDALGQAFATMVASLRRITRELLEAVNVLASSASQILATTTQIAAGAAETATSVSQTSTTVEEVKQTAQVSSHKSRTVSDGAQKAAQIAQQGRQAVGETTAGMSHIQTQMATTAESIVHLSEQNQAIS
jgi:methyl-accepting chemotaxis protein